MEDCCMNKFKFLLFSLVLLLILAACSSNSEKQDEKVPLTVSAAVSLTDALEDIKTLYEKDHKVEFTFNLQGSGSLAQQIQQGAPVDIFISANQQWMETLAEDQLIIDSTKEDVTGNKLVLITSKDSPIDYDSIEAIGDNEIKKIAIGNPESVPAGKYTEQVLQNLNLWDSLENKFILAKDVRQVLTYVETENVDIGFVYESDARSSDQVKILATAKNHTHDPIIYPAAIIKDTKHEKEATEFMTFLSTDVAQDILKNHGFSK